VFFLVCLLRAVAVGLTVAVGPGVEIVVAVVAVVETGILVQLAMVVGALGDKAIMEVLR
jgi:hypothetical protein